jgi:NAD(P)-dependent dehydrogenase (short-subunit alcohol dehydrogenase family)
MQPPIRTDPEKFTNQIAVVTGAAQGIGKRVAELFAEHGAMVVLLDVQSTGEDVGQAIRARGGKAQFYQCDVGNEKEVNSVIQNILQSFSRIDILAHIAGIFPSIPIDGHSTAEYYRVMNVNMDSCFFLTRAVLSEMNKNHYGRIVNTSSGRVQLPDTGLSAYTAAKAAIVGFTRSVAREAGAGVTANVVMPGLIVTEDLRRQHTLPDGTQPFFKDMIEKVQCVKRLGEPEDIARTIMFIASPEASFITGQIFDVGGGATFH